ncbi:CHASE domain-containing protein [Massilia sp. H-1]|nr:CHASE domain-containing protein [Massilia sp. H-1]
MFIEPPTPANLRVLGFDAWSETVRRKRAGAGARHQCSQAMSGQLTLVQDSGKAPGGSFLMVAPVYQNGLPLATRVQREQAVRGWVYAPVRARDLIASLAPELAA